MNYKEVSGGLSREEAEKYSQGIILVGSFVDSLQVQGLLPERFAQVLQVQNATTIQTKVCGEHIVFTDEERKVLLDDGAVIYLPTGETIRAQKAASRPFWYIVNGRNRLTEFPSRRIEVAIYPDLERFFVPYTFNKTTDQQIASIEADAQSLRERLRLPNIGEILPEASEATEVLFKHFDATNIRLLGQDYMHNGYWSYIRTATPINKEGSDVASVGRWDADGGLHVDGWRRDESSVALWAARWVVPTGIR